MPPGLYAHPMSEHEHPDPHRREVSHPFPNRTGEEVAAAVRKLYPTLTESELEEAERNLERYARFLVGLEEEALCADPHLDRNSRPPTMEERSNVILKN